MDKPEVIPNVNPAPTALTAATPTVKPPDAGDIARVSMGHWAQWAVAHHDSFTYTEGPDRWQMVKSEPGSLPQSCDCSSFVTGLAKWAGASDPNGLDYKGGYTGTLLGHCNHIVAANARLGDLAVYGPGTGDHVVFVFHKLIGGDFNMVSHGRQGDPSFVLHSELMTYFDGVVRFLRWLS